MLLLALDLSTSNTGWALFKDKVLIEYGSIPEPIFKGKSKLHYPQRSARLASLMAQSVDDLILHKCPDKIVIEEVSPNGISGVKSIKGLIQLHGVLLHLLIVSNYTKFDDIVMFSPREWRGAVGLKKNGDFKVSSVKMANELFKLKLNDDEHDISDAILLGHGFLKINP